jgi:hypothetical protein
LYKYFKNTNHIKKAIEQWAIGDGLIQELLILGEQANRNIVNNKMSKEKAVQTLASIDVLQKKT